MKHTWQTFSVTGGGYFPIDMLRYDSCFPANEMNSGIIENRSTRRTVKLARWVATRADVPTSARWASFGWTVEEASVITQ